jgi:hypothetical protein
MSTISSVSSTTNPYPTTNQSGLGQIVQDFNSLGSALQSGNVSAAQSALSAFQQDLQSNPQLSSSQPFGDNNQADRNYQSLVSSLQSGNLSSAQKAFASLQTDLQATQTTPKKGHGGHHHHGGGGSSASLLNSLTDDSTSNTSTNPLAAFTRSLTTSSNPNNNGPINGRSLNVTA